MTWKRTPSAPRTLFRSGASLARELEFAAQTVGEVVRRVGLESAAALREVWWKGRAVIATKDYFMGRDIEYPHAMTPEIESNAYRLVGLLNEVLVLAELHDIAVPVKAKTGSQLSDGWRPPALNAVTKGAAKNSRHMTAQAGDLYDPKGTLAGWLYENQSVLVKLGLWLEHPSATPTWCHLQMVPPKSGNRVFYP